MIIDYCFGFFKKNTPKTGLMGHFGPKFENFKVFSKSTHEIFLKLCLMTGNKKRVNVSFRFSRRLLSKTKMKEMDRFWAKNQPWTFLKIYILNLFEIVPDEKHSKVFWCDCFSFWRKFLYIPNQGEIDQFWAQNQLFWIFIKIYSLGFSEIIPHDRLWKVRKSDSFGFWSNIDIMLKIR